MAGGAGAQTLCRLGMRLLNSKSAHFLASRPLRMRNTPPRSSSGGAITLLPGRLSSVAVRFREDRFVQVYVAVPDFQVEAAVRVRAYPSFVVDCRSLATKVGERYQISVSTRLAGRVILNSHVILQISVSNFPPTTSVRGKKILLRFTIKINVNIR